MQGVKNDSWTEHECKGRKEIPGLNVNARAAGVPELNINKRAAEIPGLNVNARTAEKFLD